MMGFNRSRTAARPAADDALARLHAAVAGMPGVTTHAHRFGGVEYRRGAVELGHTHTDGRADVHVGTAEQARLLELGVAEENEWAPEPGWVTMRLLSGADEQTAVAAFRFAYDATG